MSDLVTSVVRDVSGKIVGALLGLALAAGVVVPAELSDQVTIAISGALMVIVQAAYYVLVRALERRWPGAGRLLGAAKAPTYGPVLELPVHVRTVVDHERTQAEALRIQEQVQHMVRQAQLRPPGRRT